MKWFIPFLILCTGCATGYHSTGLTGGFHETQLDTNVWRITFQGNGYTSTERAQDFTLLRASELTLNAGLKYFAVLNENDQSSISTYTSPTFSTGTVTTTGQVNDSGQFYAQSYGSSVTYPGHTFFIFKPHTTMLVYAYPGKPLNFFTYDAAFLRDHITVQYHLAPSR
jgi:hypothetical protein